MQYREDKILIQLIKKDDEKAKEELVKKHLGFIHLLVNSHISKVNKHNFVLKEDYVNAGIIGLLDSIRDYDETYSNKFLSYARFHIIKELIGLSRDLYFIKYPTKKSLKEKYILPQTKYIDDTNIIENQLIDLESENNKSKILELINNICVNEKERDILKMRFGVNPEEVFYTLDEIGLKYNYTKEGIRLIVNKLLKKIKLKYSKEQLFNLLPI